MRVWVTLPHPFGVGRAKFTRSRDEPVLSPADECPSRSRIPRRPRGRQALAPRGRGRRDDAAGQAALEARSQRDRRARSPVAGRRCGRLRHERQDDDHRHGRRDPRAEARVSPGTARARTSSPASRRRCSPRRDAELGLLEVDEGALPEVARRVRPRARLLGNLFRDQLDRYGELEHVAAHWRDADRGLPPDAVLVVNGDDPQVGDARARPRAGAIAFGIDDPRTRAADAAARGRLEVLRPLRHAVRVRRRVRRPPRRLPLPALRPRAALARGRGPRDRARRAGRAPRSTSRRRRVARVRLPLPGLYNVYNALGAAALAQALGAPLDEIAAGLERFGAAFGRFERIAAGDRTILVLLIKNPAGANEVVQTLVGRRPVAALRRAERRDRRRAGRLVDLGRRLRAAARRRRAADRVRRPRGRARRALRLRRSGRERARGRAGSSSARSTAGWS